MSCAERDFQIPQVLNILTVRNGRTVWYELHGLIMTLSVPTNQTSGSSRMIPSKATAAGPTLSKGYKRHENIAAVNGNGIVQQCTGLCLVFHKQWKMLIF